MRPRTFQRAPCWADVVADACDDNAAVSSSRGSTRSAGTDIMSTAGIASAAGYDASLSRRSRRRRTARTVSVRHSLVVMLVALAVSIPLAAGLLFDPGEQPSKPIDTLAAATASAQALADQAPYSSSARSVRLVESKGLSAMTREPVSIHPGCRRMTDLFDNVCPNPWMPFASARGNALKSELIVCPLTDDSSADPTSQKERGRRERVYAITGTITVPEDIPITSTSSDAARIDDLVPAIVTGQDRQWPRPGDEGFWRHRDGDMEWVPAEPRALLENEQATSASPAGDKQSGQSGTIAQDQNPSTDPMQAHEYDVWSASVGGEQSDTWLSFSEWREKHLAAEKERMENEKQRYAAGRKQKAADKNRESGKAQSSSHDKDGNESSAVESSEKAGDSGEAAGDEKIEIEIRRANEAQPSDAVNEASHAESAVEQETKGEPFQHMPRQKTNIDFSKEPIPALGNPSEELKQLKHRWNFASFDCAAVIHRANPLAKFASAILSEKKDRYMLSPCPSGPSDEQFVVIELCDEIIVDTLVLANYEFFSRMFKKFRVRVSKSLNGGDGDWVDIGTFRARNIRGLQVFKPVNPPGDARFYRYMRIDFQEHYGSEYYCPVSLLRVYGLTPMDDYVREEEEIRKQREREIRLLNGEEVPDESSEEHVADEKASIETPISFVESSDQTATIDDAKSLEVPVPSHPATVNLSQVDDDQHRDSANASARKVLKESEEFDNKSAPPRLANGTLVDRMTQSKGPQTASATSEVSEMASKAVAATGEKVSQSPMKDAVVDSKSSHTPSESVYPNVTSFMGENFPPDRHVVCSSSPASASAPATAVIPSQDVSSSLDKKHQSPTALSISSASQSGSAKTSGSTNAGASSDTVRAGSVAGPSSSSSSSPSQSQPPIGQANTQQTQQPGGSESIYRAITKRLNALETNATLSLQYMDHSRQMLRETFQRMERNQRDKIGQMLRELNSSNWRQIESLKRRQQVDLQQALFEFDMHRQQTDAERRALLAQVHILSNEVLLEKRFGIAQLILLLGLFVFMAFTRSLQGPPVISEGLARFGRLSPPVSQRRKEKVSENMRQHQYAPHSPRLDMAADVPQSSGMEPRRQNYSKGSRYRKLPLSDRRGQGSRLRNSRMRQRVASKLRKLMVPAQEKAISSVRIVLEDGEEITERIKPKLEPSTIEKALDVKPALAALSSPKGTRESLGLGQSMNRKMLPVSRNATLTRARMDSQMLPVGDKDCKPVTVKSESPSYLQVPAVDDSFNSDWGTERSEEGDESDASLSKPHKRGEEGIADHSTSDISISPRPTRATSLNNLSGRGSPLRVDIESPLARSANHFGVSLHDQRIRPSVNTENLGSPSGSRRFTHGHTAKASPDAYLESDAEEDQPPWNSVHNRRHLRRSGSNSHGNGSAHEIHAMREGRNDSPQAAATAHSYLSTNGRTHSTNPSRLHTPTGPAPSTYHTHAPQAPQSSLSNGARTDAAASSSTLEQEQSAKS